MKLPPANSLIAYEAAARHSSLTLASRELGVTHAAVSHQIRQLESWLGLELFRREGRGLALTEEGRALGETLTDCLRQIETRCRSLRRAHQPGALTIASLPSIASRWLIPSLPDFQAAHPDIAIRVVYAHARDTLADLDADLAIALKEAKDPGLTSRRLLSRINKPVASPHYLARSGALGSPSEIARATLLHDEDPLHWLNWCRKAGVQPAPSMTGPIFQDFNLLATAVIAGHGVALCPVDVFAREIAQGDLVVLSDISILEDEAYHLVMPSWLPAEARLFADWLIGVMKSAARS
ncbi:LysR substrate-binding domain-containing protein [Rhizobium sp. FKL33]|uniref:LysR substrate-binding domain-containing protein n=1 Tax=Rhizobium sp. FKL33 TaxID=2562307 RepID=UPI0010C0DE5A|nr:LysR substrate-binding domain-containing protein [Rhizobium sp. FKL33]